VFRVISRTSRRWCAPPLTILFQTIACFALVAGRARPGRPLPRPRLGHRYRVLDREPCARADKRKCAESATSRSHHVSCVAQCSFQIHGKCATPFCWTQGKKKNGGGGVGGGGGGGVGVEGGWVLGGSGVWAGDWGWFWVLGLVGGNEGCCMVLGRVMVWVVCVVVGCGGFVSW